MTQAHTPWRRVLVANRAEIASRVFRTCRRLGLATVAVHSDADADLPYVGEADVAVRLPGDAPGDTYLRGDLIIAAAQRTGADAIHPGYGFLSENADFARAVIEAGLVWIGPSPEAIEQMGSKIGSKTIMRAAGVPVLEAPAEPTAADLPLIVKASAGGGGRGMRIVRDLASLPGEVAAAEAEAASAFGDGTVFIEPYVESGRHVEVQIVGSADGVLVLGTRDCSLQRRHQKVIEEAPAPLNPCEAEMLAAAKAAAEAIDYRGAGTVEFLLDPEAKRFYFLEMNTRLQVEHPVTEEIYGVDLVALQLEIAEYDGRSTSVADLLADPPTPSGHAVEARLYAEDPTADYQPQTGVLTRFEIPRMPGVRVESGFATDSEVGTHYDAMLAKVIVHAPDRTAAARLLAEVLRRARLHGLVTNRQQLVMALGDLGFLEGDIDTRFLARRPDWSMSISEETPPAAVAATLALAQRAADARRVQRAAPIAWRNVVSQPQRTQFTRGYSDRDGEPITVEWFGGRDGPTVEGYDLVAVDAERVTLERDGVRTTYDVTVVGDVVDVDWSGGHLALRVVPRFTDPADAVATGSLLAPMPGTVVAVPAGQGQEVAAGDPVLVLEAMKMQHTVHAPTAGIVTRLDVEVGRQVAAGEVLAVVEPAGEAATEESA